MKLVYLFRHGQTEDNSNRIIQGQSDSLLTPEGINSASGKENKIRNIGLYIDENDLPSHVKHSYYQFKSLVEGQQADPAGKNIRVYCMTPEDWGDGGSSAHLEAAHSVVRYLFSLQGEESDTSSPNDDLSDDLSEDDLPDAASSVADDSYKFFLSNWLESDGVWIDERESLL